MTTTKVHKMLKLVWKIWTQSFNQQITQSTLSSSNQSNFTQKLPGQIFSKKIRVKHFGCQTNLKAYNFYQLVQNVENLFLIKNDILCSNVKFFGFRKNFIWLHKLLKIILFLIFGGLQNWLA